MTTPSHLNKLDYPLNFPPDLDTFPTVEDLLHYIDAWIVNNALDALKAIEQYLIDHKGNIEAAVGNDVWGEDGDPFIGIPPARYPSYKFTYAWDSNLLEENIKDGEIIFGVTGTFFAMPLVSIGLFEPTNILDGVLTPSIISSVA